MLVPSLKLILIADCGRDDSWSVIQELARDDPKMKIGAIVPKQNSELPKIQFTLSHFDGDAELMKAFDGLNLGNIFPTLQLVLETTMIKPILYRVSLVIPVYRGEKTLPTLIEEIAPLTEEQTSPDGNRFVVCEVLLVHDCGPDQSDKVLEDLSAQHSFVRPVWLSRNYGQHAATMAGMASATGDWVVTIDEDGQQNPVDISRMLDFALAGSLQLIYAEPTNPPPHGWLRNAASRTAKAISTKMLGNKAIGKFNSFRVIDGEIARTLAAYCGNGVYLDVGLIWISMRIGHCPVQLRDELDRASGYSYFKLLGHFWNLILTTGTRPLRLITIIGFLSMILAIAISGYAIYVKLSGQAPVQGWASLLIIVAFFSGAILTALGVIAEYLAVTMGIVMGKPLYVVATKPTRPAIRQ